MLHPSARKHYHGYVRAAVVKTHGLFLCYTFNLIPAGDWGILKTKDVARDERKNVIFKY
jgi:hypothetical protein